MKAIKLGSVHAEFSCATWYVSHPVTEACTNPYIKIIIQVTLKKKERKGHFEPHPVLAPILCFKKYTMPVDFFFLKKGTIQQLFKNRIIQHHKYILNIFNK